MTLQERLLELDVTANRISSGVNAVMLMSAGLDEAQLPYASGFDAACSYLAKASQALREQLDLFLDAVRQ